MLTLAKDGAGPSKLISVADTVIAGWPPAALERPVADGIVRPPSTSPQCGNGMASLPFVLRMDGPRSAIDDE